MPNCSIKKTPLENDGKLYKISVKKDELSFKVRKEALLLHGEKAPEYRDADGEFDPAEARILIDADAVIWKWDAEKADQSFLNGTIRKEEIDKGAYGIYSVSLGGEKIHFELYPGTKVGRDVNSQKSGKPEREQYEKCLGFFQSVTRELIEKSALYVYGRKGTAEYTVLDFVLEKEKNHDILTNFIFFMVHAEKIRKALEAVARNPHRVLKRGYAAGKLERAGRMDSRSVRSVFSRPNGLEELPSDSSAFAVPNEFQFNGDGGRKYYPGRVEWSRCVETYDTPENRFVVFVVGFFNVRLHSVVKWLEENLEVNKVPSEEYQTLNILKKRLLSFLHTMPFSTIQQNSSKAIFPFRSKTFSERQGYVEFAGLWRTFERGEPFLNCLTHLFSLRRYCDIFELLCFFRVIDEEAKKSEVNGKFRFAGTVKNGTEEKKAGELHSVESGLNFGCRYEIGEKAILYNFPIAQGAEKIEIDKPVNCEKKGHLRPDILVVTKHNGSWLIDRLIDAKFRNHSRGDSSYEGGCHEIQKYFWGIQDEVWMGPEINEARKTKKAEGRFIEGKETSSSRTEIITSSRKIQEVRILETKVVEIPEKRMKTESAVETILSLSQATAKK